jgi:hypothetical protein
MKPKSVTAFGIAVTIVGAGLEAEQEWCKPACDWIVEQPHVPHEPHTPTPTRVAIEFLTSAPSTATPFIPYDDSANNIVIGAHHQRRIAQSMIASMPSSSLLKMK